MKKVLIVILALTLVFALAACNENNGSEKQAAADNKNKTPFTDLPPEEIIDDYVYGGTVYIGRAQTPEGMFTPLYTETVYDSDIVNIVFEGLTTTNSNFEPVPELAQKWEISDDNKTYTFYLDKRAKFHDGQPVTAEDVKYTYEMFLHPDYSGVRSSNFLPILGAEEFRNGEADTVKGIKIIDDYTIQITLKEVYAPFLVNTATFGILPEHILSKYEPGELDKVEFNQHPIGSGPFKFVEYKTDEYVKLSAFEDYREGRPYLDNVVFRYISDKNRLIMLQKGELDWAELLGSEFYEAAEMDNITIHKQLRNGFGYLAFNLKDKDSVVSEKAVRQAIAYGVNRKEFQKVVMNGLAVNVNSPISVASWAYTDDLNQYDYNPEKAKQVLADAGWKDEDGDGVLEKDGQELSFTITASSGSQFIDQLLALAQDNLNSIGFDVKLSRIEFNTLREKIDAGELESWFMGWRFGSDPDPYNVWHSEGDWNRTGFSDPRADELIEKARKTLDKYDRKQYYVEFQKIWNESMPYLPMYANIYANAVNKRIRGLDPAPGVMNVFHEWDLLKRVWIPRDERK